MNKAVNGFEVARMMVSAAVLPRCCREDSMSSSAKRNIRSAARMYAVFLINIFQRVGLAVTASTTGGTGFMRVKIETHPKIDVNGDLNLRGNCPKKRSMNFFSSR